MYTCRANPQPQETSHDLPTIPIHADQVGHRPGQGAVRQAIRAVRPERLCRKHFTDRFYRRLSNTFGNIAHYNRGGFWDEFFTTTADKVRFLEQTLQYPCYGDPAWTYSDVERALQAWLEAEGTLDQYRQKLAEETEAAERAELARLQSEIRIAVRNKPPARHGGLGVLPTESDIRPNVQSRGEIPGDIPCRQKASARCAAASWNTRLVSCRTRASCIPYPASRVTGRGRSATPCNSASRLPDDRNPSPVVPQPTERLNRVVLNVSGGVVQDVYVADPDAIEVILVDWDTEGCQAGEDESLVEVEAAGGKLANAVVYPTASLDRCPPI